MNDPPKAPDPTLGPSPLRPIFERVEFRSYLELKYLNHQVRLSDYIAEIVADSKAQRAAPAGPPEDEAETWRDRPPLL